jgi:hypothetical protein
MMINSALDDHLLRIDFLPGFRTIRSPFCRKELIRETVRESDLISDKEVASLVGQGNELEERHLYPATDVAGDRDEVSVAGEVSNKRGAVGEERD